MADKTLEDKAVELLDASQQALATFTDKMAELTKQYGPDVMNAALQMARIDAIQNLVWALCSLAFGGFCVWACTKIHRHNHGRTYNPWEVPMVVLGLGGLLLLIIGAMGVIDVWVWVGIFEPKLWLAKRVLGL